MDKVIDFKKSVYQLSKQHPEIISIMKEIGFDMILEAGMLETAGRFMTIPKGAALKGLNMDKIKGTFMSKGYILQE